MAYYQIPIIVSTNYVEETQHIFIRVRVFRTTTHIYQLNKKIYHAAISHFVIKLYIAIQINSICQHLPLPDYDMNFVSY